MDTCVGDIIKCATERNNTTASIQGMDAEGYDVSKYAYIVGMIVNDAVNHYLNNSSGDLNQETIQRLFDQLMEAQQKFNNRIPDMFQNNGGQLFESDFIDKESDTPNM